MTAIRQHATSSMSLQGFRYDGVAWLASVAHNPPALLASCPRPSHDITLLLTETRSAPAGRLGNKVPQDESSLLSSLRAC